MDDYYCWHCDSWLNLDELGSRSEVLDPTVIDSRITYSVCPNCGSDEVELIDLDMVLGFLKELKPRDRKLGTRWEIVREWLETV